jgi:DUF4097 and DUF4098 domain-containing protein YvlB
MRRTSLVAPLLLVALGALLLARTAYPGLPVFDYVAKYWPAVLIGWGVLRIIEIVAWAAASKPLPAGGISGGEWVIIIFLCLFGVSLHAVQGISTWWPEHVTDRMQWGGLDLLGGERHEYPVSGEKTSSPAPHVLIEDFRGDAKINGIDAAPGGNSIKVTGHKIIRGLDQQQADRKNDATPLEITGDANNVSIRLHQDEARGPSLVSATLEISVPKGASVEVHGRLGDLDINDISGSVAITSDNAGVRLTNIGGDARVDLRRSDVVHMAGVKGAVEIKGRGSDIELEDVSGPVSINGVYYGTIEMRKLAKPLRFTSLQTELNIEGVPGQVRMSFGDFTASKVSGPMRLSLKSRDVEISDFTGPLEVTLERGDLDLRPGLPLASIEARSSSGDIRLALPESAQFTLNASTGRGSISNPFGGGLKLEANGRSGSLRGSVGGGPAIQLETQRGDIAVQKAVAVGSHAPLEKLDQ